MKGTLEFDLPEEQAEFQRAANAHKYSQLLYKLEQEVFRPARKHGYHSTGHGKVLNDLLNGLSGQEVADAIHEVEVMYYELKKELFGDDDDV